MVRYFALKNAGFTIQEHVQLMLFEKSARKTEANREKRQQEKMKADLAKEQDTFDLAIMEVRLAFTL